MQKDELTALAERVQHKREHELIVHQLRSRGWNRIEVEQEADNLMAERLTRRAALAEQVQQ